MKKKRTVLCLGSNTSEGDRNINESVSILEKHGVEILATSDIYPSASGYTNKVMICETESSYNALLALTKETEHHLGRLPEMKGKGVVPIDIDIVLFDSVVKRPVDFTSAYFKEGFNEAQYRLLYPND